MKLTDKKIEFTPIGVVHSPLKKYGKVPVQPSFSNIEGVLEIYKEYQEGLKDLDGFDYIICLSYFHKIKHPIPLQSPTHWDTDLHGIFAIRSPRRPNPIGFSILKLVKIEERNLYIKNLDIIDETPVLDIKPFIPSIDNRETDRIGWIKNKF